MATVRLTRKLLERIIKEERQKLHEAGFGKPEDVESRAKDTEELDADELGTDKALEEPIDHLKALKIRESAFVAALVKLSEARTKTKKNEASKKAADKKKADDKKAKDAKAKKETQDRSKKAADKKKKSKKNESVRSVKMNETQLVEALRQTRAKIALFQAKKRKKG